MIKYILMPMLSIGFISSAWAVESNALPKTSLFFSPSDAHEAEMMAQRLAPAGKGDIRLGAILYYGPDDWSVWLQNERWTPQTTREDIQILSVDPNEIRITWHSVDHPTPIEITLKPNQAYEIATGKIVSAR